MTSDVLLLEATRITIRSQRLWLTASSPYFPLVMVWFALFPTSGKLFPTAAGLTFYFPGVRIKFPGRDKMLHRESAHFGAVWPAFLSIPNLHASINAPFDSFDILALGCCLAKRAFGDP